MRKGGIALFLGLAALYAAFFAAQAWWRREVRAVRLETSRSAYYHYDFVEIRLRSRDPGLMARWRSSPPKAAVKRQGRILTTVAGLREVVLAYDPGLRAWTGRWPCPWNAEPGSYELELLGEDLSGRLEKKPFRILTRRARPLPRGFAALTFESVMPLRTMRVPTPSGQTKDWRGLLDWVEYLGADAFWMLGGQTPGERPGELWLTYNLPMIPALARECRRRGIKFGVYVMSYLTMSETNRVPGYEYARDVQEGRSVATRAVSLRDMRRPDDVAELLVRFRDIPGVDFIGIDYIRNALGGYELADDFYAEMPGVSPPPGWERLSREERMVYFARKKVMRRDKAFIDAWQWWRARRVAHIVRRIKERVGDSKPLWAFTLTWDKGWHHGQDPVMINDAGADVDALMLYEATAPQFEALLADWRRYMRRSDAQLIVGDVIDWPLHQRHPRGPREFTRRSLAAIDGIYADGPAAGVFIHDLGRALWGRLGPWGTLGWMEEARKVVQHAKSNSHSKRVAAR